VYKTALRQCEHPYGVIETVVADPAGGDFCVSISMPLEGPRVFTPVFPKIAYP
jgi:hypothetical protein